MVIIVIRKKGLLSKDKEDPQWKWLIIGVEVLVG